MAKSLAPIRRGIEYQNLVAAESLLKLLQNDDPPVAVSLEDRRGGRFDDVVEWYHDRVVWQQVKWAANPVTEPFSLVSLSKQQRSRRTSLIRGFADSFVRVSRAKLSFELHLVSNRTAAADLRALLGDDPPKIRTDLSQRDKVKVGKVWLAASGLNRKCFWAFVKCLRFRLGQPSIDERSRQTGELLRALRAGPRAFETLMKAIDRWSKDSNKDKITADDVSHVLSVAQPYPDNTFRILKPVVPRATAQAALEKRIDLIGDGYVIVLGAPGSGKSTMLNTIGPKTHLRQRHVVILYNCFTGPGDTDLQTRASARNLAVFLARQLHGAIDGIALPSLNPSEGDIEALLGEASRALPNGRRLVIMVDGLDYAQRHRVPGTANLADCLPPRPPERVTVVVSAQSANQLPTHLQGLPADNYLHTPPLTRTQVEELLCQYNAIEPSVSAWHRRRIAEVVHRLSGGHALHASYLARSLVQSREAGRDPHDMLAALPPYDGDIRRWYDAVFTVPGNTLAQDMLSVMAACPFPITPREAASLLEPPAADPREAEDAIRPYSHLFDQRDGQYCFAHDSLRAYAIERLRAPAHDQRRFLEFLRSRPSDPRCGEYILPLVVGTGDTTWASENVDCDWLSQMLMIGCNGGLLESGVRQLMEEAARRRDWVQLSRWSLLDEAILNAVDFEADHEQLYGAWLATGHPERAERALLDGEQLLVEAPVALRVSEVATHRKYDTLSKRLREAALGRPLLEADRQYFDNPLAEEIEQRIHVLAPVVKPEECLTAIDRYLSEVETLEHVGAFDRDEFRGRWATMAAFACLWARRFDLVELWLGLSRAPLDRHHRVLLRLGLHVQRGLKPPASVAKAVLRGNVSLHRLRELAHWSEFREAVQAKLHALPLPDTVRDPYYPWYDPGRAVEGLWAFFDDVSLSYQLGLRDRWAAVETALGGAQTPTIAPIHQVMMAQAVALGQPKAKADWRKYANAVARCIGTIPPWMLRPAWLPPLRVLAQHIGRLLQPLRWCAQREKEESGFAEWATTKLLSVLRGKGLLYPQAIESVITEMLLGSPRQDLCNRLLTKVVQEWHRAPEHKSGSWLKLAQLAADAGRNDIGEVALNKGVRAAFTYGYRKDTRVNAAIACLDHVGGLVGRQMLHSAAFLCAVLELLDELTDHKELSHNFGTLIAVVCRYDLPTAIRLARTGEQRLSHYMRTYSIAAAINDERLDSKELLGQFHKDAPSVQLGPFPHEVEADEDLKQFAAMGIAGIEKELRKSERNKEAYSKLKSDTFLLYRALLANVGDRQTLDEVVSLLAKYKEHGVDYSRMALKARDLGETDAACEYAAKAIKPDTLLGYMRSWADGEAFVKILCRYRPQEARTMLDSAVSAQLAKGQYGLSHYCLPVIIGALMELGSQDEAHAIYREFERSLREIVQPYPSTEAAWLDAVQATGRA